METSDVPIRMVGNILRAATNVSSRDVERQLDPVGPLAGLNPPTVHIGGMSTTKEPLQPPQMDPFSPVLGALSVQKALNVSLPTRQKR